MLMVPKKGLLLFECTIPLMHDYMRAKTMLSNGNE